jgi:hypothetical protein
MNTGKQHILFPRIPIICPRVESEGVDNPAWAPSPGVPLLLERRQRFRLCRSNFVVAAKRGSVTFGLRRQACPSAKEQGRSQEEHVPGMSAPICPSSHICVVAVWVTHRARDNLLLGCRPAFARTNPKVTEPLCGQKEVVARVAPTFREPVYQAL